MKKNIRANLNTVTVISVLLAIAVAILVICVATTASKPKTVEQLILKASQSHSCLVDRWGRDISGDFYLRKDEEKDQFMICAEGYKEPIYTLSGISAFTQTGQYDPGFTETGAVSAEHRQVFAEASQIFLEYMEVSPIIPEADKPLIREALANLVLRYGTLEQNSNPTVLLTNETEVYLIQGYEQYVSLHTALHELLHVAANVANGGEESNLFRRSWAAEALTELLTRAILESAGKQSSIRDDIAYDMYLPYLYPMIRDTEGRILEAYFVSEKYPEVFVESGLDLDLVRTYYMVIEWGEDFFIPHTYEDDSRDLPLPHYIWAAATKGKDDDNNG